MGSPLTPSLHSTKHSYAQIEFTKTVLSAAAVDHRCLGCISSGSDAPLPSSSLKNEDAGRKRDDPKLHLVEVDEALAPLLMTWRGASLALEAYQFCSPRKSDLEYAEKSTRAAALRANKRHDDLHSAVREGARPCCHHLPHGCARSRGWPTGGSVSGHGAQDGRDRGDPARSNRDGATQRRGVGGGALQAVLPINRLASSTRARACKPVL